MSLISTEVISKTYGSGSSAVIALSDISLEIDSGDFVGIVGESGSGKSTLLSVLGAMNTPTAGTYRVDDMDIYQLPPEKRADFRREFLGFVFQSFHLMSYLNVQENVMLPLVAVNIGRRKKLEMAHKALSWVGLADKAGRMPNQLSGGEQERVALARAIVNEPPILLADEPTGNLDSKNTADVMRRLQQLNADGMTILMVSHSRRCTRYARRIIKLQDGRLLESDQRPFPIAAKNQQHRRYRGRPAAAMSGRR